MASLAKSKVKYLRGICRKQGSALVLTILTLAFLLVVLSGITLDRNLRYWVSSHHRDEVISFFNAQSAHEMAEFEIQKQFVEQGRLEVSFASSVPLNDGVSRYLWQLPEHELCVQGIGRYKKSYSLLQSRYQAFQSPADFPLLLITQQLSGNGVLQLNQTALSRGIFVFSPWKQMKTFSGVRLKFLLHHQQEQLPTNLVIEEIKAWDLFSQSEPSFESDNFVIDRSIDVSTSASDLLRDHIYLTQESIRFDIREDDAIVELPSIITTGNLEIVARSDQTVLCSGLLFCANLKISQATLIMEPSQTLLDWIQNHKDLILPANYRPSPQLILARTEYRFLPLRAVGE